MDQDQTARALEIYSQAAQLHPDNPSGWEGLIGAYTRGGDFSQAISAVRSMPQSSFDAAVKNSGFLDSLAVLYSTQGHCAEAEDLLNRSLALNRVNGGQPSEST
jgi:Flp pilus assembly protein TadD